VESPEASRAFLIDLNSKNKNKNTHKINEIVELCVCIEFQRERDQPEKRYERVLRCISRNCETG